MSTGKIKKIPGYDGYYVDTEGRVFSALVQHGRGRRFIEADKLHEIKSFSLPTGHLTLRVSLNGKLKTLRPQIAVAKTFLKNSNPKEKIYVCHKDGNPKNNNVENLYWGTPAENTRDMKKHGTMAVGEKLPQSKLNSKKIKLIRSLYDDFKWTQSKIASIFGVRQDLISRIVNRIYWKHIP